LVGENLAYIQDNSYSNVNINSTGGNGGPGGNGGTGGTSGTLSRTQKS